MRVLEERSSQYFDKSFENNSVQTQIFVKIHTIRY